ncbi:MAG: DUF222 domain-containing protein, partial [Propionibacteriales bacterium]|nr:DUF222 domain-containing protein [Propionibacteriales bacterium]
MFDRRLIDTMPPGRELALALAAVDHTDLDAADALCWLRACERQEACMAARKAEVLAHFADLNATLDPVEQDLLERRIDGAPRLVQIGGDSTAKVHEFCFSELAAVLKCSEAGAEHRMAAALDLRHRLPNTLQLMRKGRLSGSRAALIARQSRCLPAEGAARLEDRLGTTACRIGYKRLRDEVDTLLIDLDPAEAARRAKEAAERRYVNIDRD